MLEQRRPRIKFDFVFVMLLFALIAFCFLSASPLHPWVYKDTGTDSSVFKTVSFMMDKGKMPYRDTFDHKGPLIYLINYAGDRISAYRGVWVFEYLGLFFTLVIWYKIAQLYCKSSLFSFVSVLTGLSLLFFYFEGGNLTEEYALPFISLGLLVYLEYFQYFYVSRIKLALCGFSFACVCLLRLNMAVVWLVFSVAVLIECVRRKAIVKVPYFALWFFVGFVIGIGPCLGWLIHNNALIDFYNDYIIFNITYSSAVSGGVETGARWSAFFTFANTIPYLMSILITVFLYRREKQMLWLYYLIFLIINLSLVSLSGRQYGHYGMVLAPAVVAPIGALFAFFQENDNSAQLANTLFSGFLLCSIVLCDLLLAFAKTGSAYDTRNEQKISDTVKELAYLIQCYSSYDEEISVYGNYDILYFYSEREHATKYSYQFPIGRVSPSIMEEYWQQLQAELPKIIVVQKGHYDNDIQSFLKKNDYQDLWIENKVNLNEGVSIFLHVSG